MSLFVSNTQAWSCSHRLKRAERTQMELHMDSVDANRESFSPDEIAQRNGLGRTTVFAEIKARRLVARKVGKRTVIRRDDERAWLESLPTAAV